MTPDQSDARPPFCEATMTLLGRRIFIAHEVPRMQLSPDVPLTPEFRAEFNTWMRRFFGTTCAIKDGEVWEIGRDLHMSLDTYQRLRQAAQRQTWSLSTEKQAR